MKLAKSVASEVYPCTDTALFRNDRVTTEICMEKELLSTFDQILNIKFVV